MAQPVVEDDHMTGTQDRQQLGFDIDVEYLLIHYSVDHRRDIEVVVEQGTDEGLAWRVQNYVEQKWKHWKGRLAPFLIIGCIVLVLSNIFVPNNFY